MTMGVYEAVYGQAPSIEDTAPSEYWTPVEEVFQKEETEEEKQERLWRAIVAASQS